MGGPLPRHGPPVIVCNRGGRDRTLDFTGAESIVAIAGRRVLSARPDRSAVLTCDWDRAGLTLLSREWDVSEIARRSADATPPRRSGAGKRPPARGRQLVRCVASLGGRRHCAARAGHRIMRGMIGSTIPEWLDAYRRGATPESLIGELLDRLPAR